MPSFRIFLLSLLPLTSSISRADDPAPVPSDPVFTAVRTDGTTAKGRIRQMGPKDQVVLTDGESNVTIPFKALVKLSREGSNAASPPMGQVVLFPDGDRLRAMVGNSTDTSIELQPPTPTPATPSPLDSAVSIPLEAPLALLLVPTTDLLVQEKTLSRLRNEPRKSEVLRMANEDRIEGGLLGIGAQKIKFEPEDGAREIDRTQVTAIEFNPKLTTYPEPNGAWLELAFTDGSRLGASSARIESGRIVFLSRFGATMRVPIGSLVSVHARGGPIAYLSERQPDASEYIGYLGAHRGSHGRDLAADGRTMRLGRRPIEHGLGTEPRTLLAYRLKPGDRRFQATVGLDDRAGVKGSVTFRVLVDGKERFASPPMTPRDAPTNVDVDLKGARVLILATEFGEAGDVQDLADWAEARIIRGDE